MSCRYMKKIIGTIVLLLVCVICIAPMDIYADDRKEIRAEFQNGIFDLAASSDVWNYADISPGDTYSYRYIIKNNTKGLVEVKLSEITNGIDSELYRLLDADLNQGGVSSLSAISSDWTSIRPGEETAFDINVHFPENADNQFQGKELHAKAVFQGRMAETGTVKTGDPGGVTASLIVAVLSVMVIFVLRRCRKIERRTR